MMSKVNFLDTAMKKALARILVITTCCLSIPVKADGESGGGGGGGGGGAGAGIAIGAAVIAGLIGLVIYNVNKEKSPEAPKAEDPFAPVPSETDVSSASRAPRDSSVGGIGANKKLEF